jgi:hypothetical protein
MADQKIKPSTPRYGEQLAQSEQLAQTVVPSTPIVPLVDARVTL